MKRVAVVCSIACAALTGAANAHGAVIKTNWSERVDYANMPGFVRLYVRKIQLTPKSWTAWVGITNNSRMNVRLWSRLEKPVPTAPFTYWAGPGIWWSSYVSGKSWWPGAGAVLTHATKGRTNRPYPTALGPRKSWFGTFAGSTSKLPRDRLLRIGFGILDYPQPGPVVDLQGRPLRREIVLSTTHQFKLPRRLT